MEPLLPPRFDGGGGGDYDSHHREMLDHFEENGDVSETARRFFKKSGSGSGSGGRALVATKSSVTFQQIDRFLDKLTTLTKNDEQVRAFSRFILHKLTPTDLKWLIRLVMGDLKIYAGPRIVLDALHVDAYNAWIVSNDLKSIVDSALSNPGHLTQLSQQFTQDKDNNADDEEFRLSSSDDDDDNDADDANEKKSSLKKKQKGKARAKESTKSRAADDDDDSDDGDDDEKDRKRKKTAKMRAILKAKPKENSGSESESAKSSASSKKSKGEPASKRAKLNVGIKLFTPIKPMLARATKSYDDAMKRCPNGFYIEIKYDGERIQIHKQGDKFKCFSRNLKPVMEWKVEAVKSYISKAVSSEVKSMVLDGEILLIDKKTKSPLPFGSLGVHKKTQFKEAEVAIFLFDILYLDGETLLSKPIIERRKLLEKYIKVIDNHIMLSEQTVCDVKDMNDEAREAALADHMNTAIADGLEGLVIKDLQSIYEPAARHWLKVKKDYLKGLADSVDLVVLGAYFGTGSKGGLMSVFLMGVYDKDTDTYKAVCKCGNGHSDATILELNKELEPNMTRISKDFSKVPSWLDCDRPQAPDFVVIDPKKSVVWEIAGAELNESTHHNWKDKRGNSINSIGIRFPRVIRIRDDKDVEDATSLAELRDLLNTSKRKGLVSIMTQMPVKSKVVEEPGTSSSAANDDGGDSSSDEGEAKSIKKRAKSKPGPSGVKKTGNADDDSETEEPKPHTKQARPQPVRHQAAQSTDSDDDDDDNDAGGDFSALKLDYWYGDFSRLADIGTGSAPTILVHCVDDSGRWSSRGAMGQIVTAFGDEPKEDYESASSARLGDIQTVEISGKMHGNSKVWVITMLCMEETRGNPPSIDYNAFKSCIKKLSKFALEKSAPAVHFVKLHRSIPNLDWTRVENVLKGPLVSKGVRVVVYTRDFGDKSKCARSIKIDVSKPAAAASSSSASSSDTKSSSQQSDKGVSKQKHSQHDDDAVPSAPQKKPQAKLATPKENAISSKASSSATITVTQSKPVQTSGAAVLVDIFTGLVVCLMGFDPEEVALLKRYIVAYDGDVLLSKYMDDGVTHVVAKEGPLEKDVAEFLKFAGIKAVEASWVWDSVNARQLKPESDYEL